MRVVDVLDVPVRRFVSRARRRAERVPVAPLRREVRRVPWVAVRSPRLPFFPGVPIPAARLRVNRRVRPGFVAVRGWMAGGRWSSGV